MTELKRAELELNLQLEDHARFIKEQQAAEALAARRLADLQRHLRRMLADDDEAGMLVCMRVFLVCLVWLCVCVCLVCVREC